MRIIYFDEVKYQKGNQPYYWIGGLAVTPDEVYYLEHKTNELSQECFGYLELSGNTEFHAADIFHRKKNFKYWKNIKERILVLKKLAEILDSESGVEKIYVQIDPQKITSQKYIEKIDELAFMYFVEQVDKYLADIREPGMLIGDRENKDVVTKFSEELSSWRTNKTHFKFGVKINYLIDTVHFSNSHHSRILQLADLYVWLLQLINSNPDRYPHNSLISHVKKNTRLHLTSKYNKIWPTDQSWYL